MKETINNLEELLKKINPKGGLISIDLENIIFDFEFNFYNPIKIISFNLSNCEFKKPFILDINKKYGNLNFTNCIFHDKVDFSENKIKFNVRFFNCNFNDFIVTNTSFEKLADFWRSSFSKPLIFLKTDFKGITVFSAATFKENVLFTYSLFEKSVFFRGTKFEKGLDLSLAVSTGTLGLFDIRLNQFNSIKNLIDKDEDGYEEAITETAQIPLKNKLETFRILKKRFEDLGDIPSSIEFKVLEKEALKEKIFSKNYKNSNWWTTQFDKASIWLNKKSNNFGSSINRALIFTILVGFVFYIFSLLSIFKQMDCRIYSEIYLSFFSNYIKFMNPTHNNNYLGLDLNYNDFFYLFDYIGRAFIGYGTYQFIQAFRKFK